MLHFFLCHDHSTTTAWNCRRRKRKDNFFLACGVLQFNYRKIRLHLLFANYLPHRGFLQCYFAPETPKHCLSTIPFQCVELNWPFLNVIHKTWKELIIQNYYFRVYNYIIRSEAQKYVHPNPYDTRTTEHKRFGLFFSFNYHFQVRSNVVYERGRGIYGVMTPLKRWQSRLRTLHNIDSWIVF